MVYNSFIISRNIMDGETDPSQTDLPEVVFTDDIRLAGWSRMRTIVYCAQHGLEVPPAQPNPWIVFENKKEEVRRLRQEKQGIIKEKNGAWNEALSLDEQLQKAKDEIHALQAERDRLLID